MLYYQGGVHKQKRFLWVLSVAFCAMLLCACQTVSQKQSVPQLASDLLLEDGDLPGGWVRIRDMPINSLSDPAINHVYRSWWGKEQGYGKVEQVIWRSSSADNAKQYFDELRGNQFDPIRTPKPELKQIYIHYEKPNGINFESGFADEIYYACGWSGFPRCVMIARYKNFTTALIVDWQTTGPDGKLRQGVDLTEFERLMFEVDKRFAEILK
jgi:hypothetical protein